MWRQGGRTAPRPLEVGPPRTPRKPCSGRRQCGGSWWSSPSGGRAHPGCSGDASAEGREKSLRHLAKSSESRFCSFFTHNWRCIFFYARCLRTPWKQLNQPRLDSRLLLFWFTQQGRRSQSVESGRAKMARWHVLAFTSSRVPSNSQTGWLELNCLPSLLFFRSTASWNGWHKICITRSMSTNVNGSRTASCFFGRGKDDCFSDVKCKKKIYQHTWQLVIHPALTSHPPYVYNWTRHLTPTLSMRAAFGEEFGGTPDWSRQKALQGAEITVHLSKTLKTRTCWNLQKTLSHRSLSGAFARRTQFALFFSSSAPLGHREERLPFWEK